jgi:hypothetical protein
MTVTIIENGDLRVGIAVDFGARVVDLVDKSSGRNWMTRGGQSPNTGEDAVYSGDEAVAWDECFPTVGTWDGSATPWRRPLRDHGDLWGRPWQVERSSPDLLELSYAEANYRFARTLRLDGRTLIADYVVTNLAAEPLPYLWALHALLAVRSGDRIELPGVGTVRGSYVALGGDRRPSGEFDWSGPNPGLPFALNEVQPPSTGFAGKFLASGVPGGRARIGQPGQWLDYAWDRSIEDLGIWITYGAWPAPGGHHEVALEPQSAPADHLGQAIEAGASPLAVGETRRWQVTLTASA